MDPYDKAVRNLLERVCKLEKELTPVIVDNYEDAAPYFTGKLMRIVVVRTDSVHNDGDKAVYRYIPGIGVGQIAIDFEYNI